ncbi:unnamed protein product [Sphagnum jensenii]|uniref:Xylanase inhibitor N-terminal domain-containing protein n=1 Tax=Sphagnum jensenii TaxID=128206 RepID=A0ABP1AB25_9BRYO
MRPVGLEEGLEISKHLKLDHIDQVVRVFCWESFNKLSKQIRLVRRTHIHLRSLKKNKRRSEAARLHTPTQTGDFLNGTLAPDGVLGLGTGNISVLSTLKRELGLLDSFSICTSFSGTGRIAFGDKGPITQQTTPFVSNSSQENLVEITALEVGNKIISVGLNDSLDTLVYYTYLPSAIYTQFANTYRSLINLPNLNLTALGLGPLDLDLCFKTM